MEAGDLRDRITIQSVTYVRDAYGEAVPTWATAWTRWANVKELSGNELFRAKQVNAEVSHEVQIRYLAGLTAKHRILYDGTRILEIAAVTDPDGRSREMKVLCTETVDAV